MLGICLDTFGRLFPRHQEALLHRVTHTEHAQWCELTLEVKMDGFPHSSMSSSSSFVVTLPAEMIFHFIVNYTTSRGKEGIGPCLKTDLRTNLLN
jgi:hypothetical protein